MRLGLLRGLWLWPHRYGETHEGLERPWVPACFQHGLAGRVRAPRATVQLRGPWALPAALTLTQTVPSPATEGARAPLGPAEPLLFSWAPLR